MRSRVNAPEAVAEHAPEAGAKHAPGAGAEQVPEAGAKHVPGAGMRLELVQSHILRTKLAIFKANLMAN